MHIKKIGEFINERMSINDDIFYAADELVQDWRKNGYNEKLDAEYLCDCFGQDYDVFREEMLGEMTGDDLVLMMSKIHNPPMKDFEARDFIGRVCETGGMTMASGDAEDEFGVDPYQSYTFGGDFEGTAQLYNDLKNCVYCYAPVDGLDEKTISGISPVADYIVKNAAKNIYYKDKVATYSYVYENDGLYINRYKFGTLKSRWIPMKIKLYAAELSCEHSSDKYLVLSCENN